MNKQTTLSIVFAVVVLIAAVTGCTNREAATLGAMIGHRIGSVFGTAAVAVEETFETTQDVQAANPRWDNQPQHQSRRHPQTPQASSSRDSQTHYYSTQVVIETQGPANIRSVQAGEAIDVTRFWEQ